MNNRDSREQVFQKPARWCSAQRSLAVQLQPTIKHFGRTLHSLSDNGCFSADPAYEPDFKHIEDNPGLTVTFNETAAGEASKERSRKLFLILGGILKHRPLKILRQVQHQNGLEAWRQLSALCVPRTKGRSLALLNAVMQFPVMTKDKTLLEQILLLERLSDEYIKSAGHQVAPDILLSTLVRILPKMFNATYS